MNIIVRAYLDGVVICLIALGTLYGIASAAGHDDDRTDEEIIKELTLFALGWPSWLCGVIAYHVSKLWQTRDNYPRSL